MAAPTFHSIKSFYEILLFCLLYFCILKQNYLMSAQTILCLKNFILTFLKQVVKLIRSWEQFNVTRLRIVIKIIPSFRIRNVFIIDDPHCKSFFRFLYKKKKRYILLFKNKCYFLNQRADGCITLIKLLEVKICK